MNFAVLEPPAKVFSTKFGRAVPTYDRLSIPRKFSLRKFPLCGMLMIFTITNYSYTMQHSLSIFISRLFLCAAPYSFIH